MTPNRHIVDQLADVRAEIKTLQDREKVLKAAVSKRMGEADTLGGDEFIAIQTLTERAGSIDAKAMERAGIDPARFRKPAIVVQTIRVERRVSEVA